MPDETLGDFRYPKILGLAKLLHLSQVSATER
jgi:hypothetical protein